MAERRSDIVLRLTTILLLAGLLTPAPSLAQAPVAVDLALVLAVDVSESVDRDEARLQRQGYVRAIQSTDVVEAILAGPSGRIAITYVEWAGPDHFFTIVDWSLIDSPETARDFALRLDGEIITNGYTTSISSLLRRARGLFQNVPYRASRLVLDISGDGPNNDGGYIVHDRDRLLARGVTINGLPILNDRPSPSGYPVLSDLSDYYRSCVIGGAGAFQVAAVDFNNFADAIQRKLFLEIALSPLVPQTHAHLHRIAADPAYDCHIGEKQSRERIRKRFQTTGEAEDG